MSNTDWAIKFNQLETAKRSYAQESLMTLGNGYLGWRGAPVWSSCSTDHYPGLYVAGIFNRTHTTVETHDVENEDMVNLPNPQLIKIFIDDQCIDFSTQTTQRKSEIDLKKGQQKDCYTVQLEKGQLILSTIKEVDPVNFHQIGFSGTITSDFPAKIRIESWIDGTVLNQNVERYRAFDSKEFEVVSTENKTLIAKTRSTKIDLVLSAKTVVSGQELRQIDSENPETIIESGTFHLEKSTPLSFEKVIVIATSYETKNPLLFVKNEIKNANLSSIQTHRSNYWEKVWREADIKIKSDHKDLQLMTRMNIFHIRQAAQHEANQYLDASIGSRALTGEGYRGHIFWDEIFVLPYFAANEPKTARDLLLYRIRRIDAAKANAKIDDETGAMFPWQSAMIGDEQSQFVHLNPVNKEWEPDHSRRQRHVSLAIVYNLWIYIQLTNDNTILKEGGLELLIETTKFWLNKAQLGKDGRFHITGVMGPDEYHEAYPGQAGGIRDNAYTNLMVVWQLNWLFELREKGFDLSALGKTQLDKAQEVAHQLYLNIDENGVIEQYDGFFKLDDVDFDAYKKKYGDIHRLDRILKANGYSPDCFKVVKQADLLMILYNLGKHKTKELVEQLGYTLPENWLTINRDYYLSCTVHGSTTSRPVFGGIAVQLGETQAALDNLIVAIGSDYYDIQGGTTAEGVHIGVMGETLEVIQNEFAGVDFRDGYFSIAPTMPQNWTALKFTQKFHGAVLNIDLFDNKGQVTSDQKLRIFVYGKEEQLTAGVPLVFKLK
ncbi:MAG: glycosyl hydrolase family 65 protein [Lactococcus hircilactis]